MDYDYVNARIRSMKSFLLGDETLESFIHKPDLDSVISELGNTPYREELEKATAQYSGMMSVEVALRRDFTRNFRKILGFVREGDAEKYIRILLSRWDIQNIKTVLRGKNIYADPTEIIECLVPAGELDDATLIELIKQPDVRAVIDLLATWRIEYARPLTRNFKEYNETRDLAILEYALDKFYYENALGAVKGGSYNDRIILEMITTEIDVTNIKTILKIIRDRADIEDAEKYLMKGGTTLNFEKMRAMLRTGTIEGVIKQLETTPYNFLSKVPEKAVKGENISVLEKELDNFLMKRGINQFLGDPLSIAVAVGYLWAKYREVTNLRIIARCKTADVPEKELRGELLHV